MQNPIDNFRLFLANQDRRTLLLLVLTLLLLVLFVLAAGASDVHPPG